MGELFRGEVPQAEKITGSFRELEVKEHVTAAELKTTLGKYAEKGTGGSISADVVNTLIDRTPGLSMSDLQELLDVARQGEQNQGNPKDKREYRTVAHKLERMMWTPKE